MSWPHTWVCNRLAAGSQNADTGAHTPGAPTAIYSGPADCQDTGEVLQLGEGGRPTVMSDAVLFLEDESKVDDHQPGDVGTVTWEDGSTDDARVERVVRLDGKLLLNWL